MSAIATEEIPAVYMAAGFKIAPRYTIAGEPKRIRGWQLKATSDPKQLQSLLQEANSTVNHFKGRGIANDADRIIDFIVVPPKRFCIIDLDNKSGKNGSASWLELCAALGSDAPTPTLAVKSKSGGFHYYFRTDTDYVKSLSNLAGYLGVDIRGQRGHAVLPYRSGPLESWQPGEYLLYEGDPREELPLFKVSKISKAFADNEEKLLLDDIKESVAKLEPIDFVPEGMRDNLLWEAACIMYRKGVKRAAADEYALSLADACQPTPELSVDQIRKLAADKVDRVYRNDRKIVTVIDFERELALGGIVRIANEGPSKYFFEHPNIFKLDAKAVYSKDALADTFKSIRIVVDDGEKQKIRTGDELFRRYVPEQTVYGVGFYPDTSVSIFKDDTSGYTLYNSYIPTFTIESASDLIKGAQDLYPNFIEFLQYLHPQKWSELLNRIAWSVQFPQLKMASLSVYVSDVQGVGKDTLCELHGLMIGSRHYKTLNSIEELTTRFMDFSDTLLVNVAEAQMGKGLAARNKMTEFRGVLKTLTTSSMLKMERKNVQSMWTQNYTNFVLTTNEFNPNMLEPNDRRHEIFTFPSETKMDQARFGQLGDLSKPRNFPKGLYPQDKLATIWWGLKHHKIEGKRYHIDHANMDEDKQAIFNQAVSPLQAWLITELPDIFSKDFVTWFIANFYPQRDKLKPMEETEYFFGECKNMIHPIRNTKGSSAQRLSLTKLHRLSIADGRSLDLQRRTVPRGPNYFQYLFTIRNHGQYDDRPTEAYYVLEDEIIKYYKARTAPVTNVTEEDLNNILTRFKVRLV